MSENIRRMLAERRLAEQAGEAALRRELMRQLVDARRTKFIAAFERQQRYYRAKAGRGPVMTLDAFVECEAADLAQDPGWGPERAWRFSEARDAAIAEVEAELARRGRK